jgi:2,3-bisphosphoglycerate-independent phosphoglycerate mutase
LGQGIAEFGEEIMNHTPHVLFLFLDGVGLGGNDRKYNPFLVAKMPVLKKFFGGIMPTTGHKTVNTSEMSFKPIDATLGIPGLPQSGTGQSALLTGKNTAKVIGKHFGPHLYSSLKPVVDEYNIFRKLQSCDKKILYANAFPKQYFKYLNSPKYRATAITHAWLSTGNRLHDSTTLQASKSLSADISNERWRKLGYADLPIISVQEAGRRLIDLTERNDFVLYEYYFTDHAGHNQSMNEAVEILEKLDGLIDGILQNLDHRSMLFLTTSDHGNLEDLSTKSHTRNPVPFLTVGRYHEELAKKVKNITDVAPAITDILI